MEKVKKSFLDAAGSVRTGTSVPGWDGGLRYAAGRRGAFRRPGRAALDSAATVLENKRYTIWAGVTQLVECNLAKVDVASSSLVSRSIPLPVRDSTPIPGSAVPFRRSFPEESFGLKLAG